MFSFDRTENCKTQVMYKILGFMVFSNLIIWLIDSFYFDFYWWLQYQKLVSFCRRDAGVISTVISVLVHTLVVHSGKGTHLGCCLSSQHLLTVDGDSLWTFRSLRMEDNCLRVSRRPHMSGNIVKACGRPHMARNILRIYRRLYMAGNCGRSIVSWYGGI